MQQQFYGVNNFSLITQATFIPYSLPLTQVWKSAAGLITTRSGWIVHITTADGYTGTGDCAPLPQAGTETFAAAHSALIELMPALINRTISDSLKLIDTAKYRITPSVCYGIETALISVLAQIQGISLAQWFCSNANQSVPINANVGAIDIGIKTRIEAAINAGYTVLKLKLGMQSWQTELEQLNLIASDLPSTISLRLDANQSWNEQQATTILKQLIGIPIESIEEPLLHPDFATLDKLQTMIPFAIALDETLPKIAQQIFTNMYCPVRRLIIKPSVIGGLRQAFNWIQQAQQCKLEWVITSTLESGIGVLAAAHLAAALQAKLAQGLATTVWFTQDIIPPLNINNGVLIL